MTTSGKCDYHDDMAVAIRTLTDSAVTQNQFYSELKDLMRSQQAVSEQITQLIARNSKKEVMIICLVFVLGMLSGQLDWLAFIA